MRTIIIPTSLLLAAMFCGTAHAQNDYALRFNGSTDYVSASAHIAVANNFTMEAWIYPTASHEVDAVSHEGYAGMSGQRYAIYPTHGTAAWGPGHAGAGFSAGTNGISVYEHAQYYIPAVLSYQAPIDGWTHVAVVYRDGTPSLYINGDLAQTGTKSPMQQIHPGGGNNNETAWMTGGIGGGRYGYFQGSLDNVRIWNRALGESEIRSAMLSTPADATGLVLEYDMNRTGEGEGLSVATSISPALGGLTAGTKRTPVFEPRQPVQPRSTPSATQHVPEIVSDVHRPAVQETDHVSGTTTPSTPTTGARLEVSRPNPFTESAEITYELPSSGHVRIEVYDAGGRQVTTLVNGEQSAGQHSVLIQGSELGATGTYQCRLVWNGAAISRPMVLVR